MGKQIFFLAVIFSALCLAPAACAVDPQDLTGRWQAVAFYTNGQSVDTALDSVQFHLTADKRYTFQSQGFYEEAGHYRLSASYLFLSDTTIKPVVEKTVRILYLSPDSLKIEMKMGSDRQVLFFKRKA